MNTSDLKRCKDCRHSVFLVAKEMTVCRYPRVLSTSVVTPNRLIGLHSGVCRCSPLRCGREGVWWEAKTCA